MPEKDNKDNKERNKKQGQNGSQVSLRDPGFGPPEPQPDGTYLVGFNALVYWGSKPAWGEILWRPRVNGQLVGVHFQIVMGARIEYKFKLSGEKAEKPSIAIDIKYGEWERTIPLQSVELPKPKRKIEIVSALHHEDQLKVIFRRVGKDGKSEAGSIMTWDFEMKKGKKPKWRIFKWVIGPDEENFLISFQCRENPRTLTFFLPDDKEIKTSVQIPAKQMVPQKKEIESKSEISSFERGREAFRKLFPEPEPLTLDVDFSFLSEKSKENERR